MDRRSLLLKGGVALGCYFWIPRIAIAKQTGEITHVSMETRQVLEDNFGLVHQQSVDLASISDDYEAPVHKARKKLAARDYVHYDRECTRYSQAPRRRKAMFGAIHKDNYHQANVYMVGGEENATAMVPMVPYLRHGAFVKTARNRGLSQDEITGYLYPSEPADFMEAYVGDNIPAERPIRVACKEGIWALFCTAEGTYSGHGQQTLYRRRDMHTIYAEVFEYDFS